MNQLQPDVLSVDIASVSCRSRVLDYDLARWATELRPHLDSKQQSLRLELDAAPLPPVRYDRDKLHQAIVNLVHDAHTFTDAGGHIALAAHATGETVTIEIRDNAGSIPASSRSAGRGLAIARRIIELHGGAISMRTDPNRGNTFGFSIPVHKPQGGALTAA
jgi:two-component system sensor histidine kinase ResE